MMKMQWMKLAVAETELDSRGLPVLHERLVGGRPARPSKIPLNLFISELLICSK